MGDDAQRQSMWNCILFSGFVCMCATFKFFIWRKSERERNYGLVVGLSACLLACLLDVGCARFRVFMHVRLILIVEKLFFLQQQQWRRRHHSMFAMYTIYAYKIDLENANAKRTHAPFTHPRSMCYDLLSDA